MGSHLWGQLSLLAEGLSNISGALRSFSLILPQTRLPATSESPHVWPGGKTTQEFLFSGYFKYSIRVCRAGHAFWWLNTASYVQGPGFILYLAQKGKREGESIFLHDLYIWGNEARNRAIVLIMDFLGKAGWGFFFLRYKICKIVNYLLAFHLQYRDQ